VNPFTRLCRGFRNQIIENGFKSLQFKEADRAPDWIAEMMDTLTDAYKLRETYGHRTLLMGGVNKLALIAGEKAIDKELERLTPLLKDGGYIRW